MTIPFADFECDKCGACCQVLFIEADYCDGMREPRLYDLNPTIDAAKLREGLHCLATYDVDTHQCGFLREDKTCDIYATRPNCCVMVEPGDAKCQQARLAKSLPLLCDKHGNEPTREVLEESCEVYELDYEDFFDK